MPSVQDRIIHAALSLINEHGLAGVTMTGVARAAGVARQTLYNHYRDVDAIVAGTIRQHNEEAVRQLHVAVQVVDTPTAKIEQLVRHVASVSAHHNQLLETPSLSREARATLDSYDREMDYLLGRILEDGQESGDFRADLDGDVDPVLIRNLLGGVAGLVAAHPNSVAEVVSATTRTVLVSLSTK